MPKLFKFGAYNIYFWSNEQCPLEPVHVHACIGKPYAGATKIWMLKNGGVKLDHNKSEISGPDLNKIFKFLIANSDEIRLKWVEYFGEISYVK